MKFDLRKFLAVVAQVGPVVMAAVPGGEKIGQIIPKVVDAIGEAEQIRGATGAEKKAHVLNVVKGAVDALNTSGRVKLNPGEVEAIASQGIDTVVATVHVIEGAKVVKPGTGSTSPGAGTTAGVAGSVPGVDTAPRSSDLGDGRATHGHGSSDHLPPAPAASGTDNPPPSPGDDRQK